jgi:VCBS repeat-containing protein
VLANDIDPDEDDTLTIASVDDTDTVGTVTVSEDGTNVSYDPGDAFPDLGPLETTEDTFTYTIQDAAGEEATATVVVTVTGAAEASPDFLF